MHWKLVSKISPPGRKRVGGQSGDGGGGAGEQDEKKQGIVQTAETVHGDQQWHPVQGNDDNSGIPKDPVERLTTREPSAPSCLIAMKTADSPQPERQHQGSDPDSGNSSTPKASAASDRSGSDSAAAAPIPTSTTSGLPSRGDIKHDKRPFTPHSSGASSASYPANSSPPNPSKYLRSKPSNITLSSDDSFSHRHYASRPPKPSKHKSRVIAPLATTQFAYPRQYQHWSDHHNYFFLPPTTHRQPRAKHSIVAAPSKNSTSTATQSLFFSLQPSPSRSATSPSSIRHNHTSAAPSMRLAPGPSDAYYAIIQEVSRPLRDPTAVHSKKLLVLDLNNTLLIYDYWVEKVSASRPSSPMLSSIIATPVEMQRSQSPHPTEQPTDEVYYTWTIARPYVPAFLDYIFHPQTREWLDTLVWSSTGDALVKDMMDTVFGDRQGMLRDVWGKSQLGMTGKGNHRRWNTFKDLQRVWDEIKPGGAPGSPLPTESSSGTTAFSPRTTILLDDSTLKARMQPFNHLSLLPYTREIWLSDMHAAAKDRMAVKGGDQKAKNAYSRVLESGLDPTMLAIVGLIEEMKGESNVASWIRSGGVWHSSSDGGQGRDEGESQSPSATGSSGAESPVSPAPGSAVSSSGSPLTSAPVSPGTDNEKKTSVMTFVSSRSPPASRSGSGHASAPTSGTPQFAQSLPPSLYAADWSSRTHAQPHTAQYPHSHLESRLQAPQDKDEKRHDNWFTDRANRDFWVQRGCAVLEEMRIEIRHGCSTELPRRYRDVV